MHWYEILLLFVLFQGGSRPGGSAAEDESGWASHWQPVGDRRGPETCHTAHQRGNQHLSKTLFPKSKNAPPIFCSCERNDHRLIITSILYHVLIDEPATEGVHPIWRQRGGRAVPERSGGSPFPPRVCLRGKRGSSQMKYVDKRSVFCGAARTSTRWFWVVMQGC